MPSEITTQILNIIAEHRRIPENEKSGHTDTEFSDAAIEKVENMVTQGKKIRLVVPAFPSKAAVRGKTLSDSPDMAELVSLKHLNEICNDIEKIYGAGAEIVIYTDGFAFADVLPKIYTQENRDKYLLQLNEMIEKSDLKNVKVINLAGSVDLNQYAESKTNFRARITNPKTDSDINSVNLYLGQTRFFTTELSMLYPDKSKSKITKEAKEIACGVSRMSAALSEYLSIVEPDVLRLSCHPKTVASDKIGIWFNQDHSPGGTPWHNAAAFEIKESNHKCGVTFMKAQEARDKGYRLQTDKNGSPSHFESEEVYRHACTLQSFFRAAHSKRIVEQKQEEASQLLVSSTL